MCMPEWGQVMNITTIARAIALAGTLTFAGGVSYGASIDPLGPYFDTGTCDLMDVTPNSDLCYGSVSGGSTNAQQVDVNAGTFYNGPTVASTFDEGLFGYDDWQDLFSIPSFGGDQKSGSFDVGDYSGFGAVVVMLKAGNSWAAYLHQGGLGPVTYMFDLDDALGAGLSNVRIVGRDGVDTYIPLPAAGWLLLGGIGGLVALRRKKSA